jgi:hypothetical protein
MLAGATATELARLVDDVQARWISFIHQGHNSTRR